MQPGYNRERLRLPSPIQSKHTTAALKLLLISRILIKMKKEAEDSLSCKCLKKALMKSPGNPIITNIFTSTQTDRKYMGRVY